MSLGDKFGRIIVPLVTPFNQSDGNVNYEYVSYLTDYLIKNKLCDSIIVAGTTGEFNTLTYEERIMLFNTVLKANEGRVPLIAGTGAASTREAIMLTREAEKSGFDAAMVVAPYYCKPTQEAVYKHYKAIASETALEIILYNIPIFTGINVSVDIVSKLSKIHNIRGIKDEAGINPTQMTEYTNAADEPFTVYNGDDIMILCGMVQGAAGVVSGASHIIGHIIRQMITHFLNGDIDEARVIHMKVDPFLKALCQNGRTNPIPILRAAMEIIGLEIGPARAPLDVATDCEKEVIKEHLLRLEVIK